MKILVCGGRTYGTKRDEKNNRVDDPFEIGLLNKVLSSIFKVDLLINGNAKGADALSTAWATENKVPTLLYPAEWDKYYKSAGPIRNLRMLKESAPDMVVAFSGGKGTAHVIETARANNVAIWDLSSNDEFNTQFLESVHAEISRED